MLTNIKDIKFLLNFFSYFVEIINYDWANIIFTWSVINLL